MSFELEATYENGTLKLDRPLPLVEHQRVKVVVQESKIESEPPKTEDWWQVLQEILADQRKRGYVGTVTEFDRSDEAYEARMREILSHTVHGKESG